MLKLFRRVLAPTIWAPGAIPASEAKYATPLKRVALPLYDLGAVAAGIYAIRSGIPSLDALLPHAFADSLGYFFIAAAVVCLAGIVFPKLWAVEMIGKGFLFAFLGTYLIALRTLADQEGSGTRDFISAIVYMVMLVPLLRLWILGLEYRDRKKAVADA
jgi:hypothetical protein